MMRKGVEVRFRRHQDVILANALLQVLVRPGSTRASNLAIQILTMGKMYPRAYHDLGVG